MELSSDIVHQSVPVVTSDVVEDSVPVVTQKPKLGLQTPKTAVFPEATLSAFPSELSALSSSARSPYPGLGDFLKFEDGLKTPITPPSAYMDFLKTKSFNDKGLSVPTPTSAPSSAVTSLSSAIISIEPPSVDSTSDNVCTCTCLKHKTLSPTSSPGSSKPTPSPSTTSPTQLDMLNIPSSARVTARSSRSPMVTHVCKCAREDYLDVRPPQIAGRIHQIREVTTRTVVYTPRMSAAPKGKRRKLDSDSASASQDED